MPRESSTEDLEDKSQDGSSAEKTTDENAASSPAEDTAPKSSKDVLDKVLQVAKGEENSPDSEDGQAAPTDKAKTAEADEELPDEVSEDELKAYKPKTRKRIQNVLAQRDAYSIHGTPDDFKQFKESHERFNRMVTYVRDAGLSDDEVNAGLNVMRLMKMDPFQALEVLRPYVQELERATGVVIPADLQEQVKTGHITEAAAQELAQARARAKVADATAARATQEAETVRTNQATSANQRAVADAVTNWQRQWQSKDPDYEAKYVRVSEKVQIVVQQRVMKGISVSPADAVKISQEALEAVNKEMRGLIPKKAAIKPPVTGGGAEKGGRPVPKSSMDALNRGLALTSAA